MTLKIISSQYAKGGISISRTECLNNCYIDNFPNIEICNLPTDYVLEFNDSHYTGMFMYPETNSDYFKTCLNYSKQEVEN